MDVPFETLSVAQVELLHYLAEHPGLRPSDLADRLLLAPSTISTLLNLLIGKKLVERRSDASDRRARQLHLTGTGTRQLAAWRASNEQVLRTAFAQVGDRERAAIHRALPALNLLVLQLDEHGRARPSADDNAPGAANRRELRYPGNVHSLVARRRPS